MKPKLQARLKNRSGISSIIALLLVLVILLSVSCLVPVYSKYQGQAKETACAVALDTARRQLATEFMANGYQNGSAEDAKEYITFIMNGWDDLCPAGGNVYIVPKGNSPLDWEIVCGLHGKDSLQCTRLNSGNVYEQIQEGLRREQAGGTMTPESLPYTIHHKEGTALRVTEKTNIRRGTRLMADYDGIVAFYGLAGTGDFPVSAKYPAGSLYYFCYADEEHYAFWSADYGWGGDSYSS